ncbi:MAG: hypothetical protein U1F35_17085 [Steroidobacteraceae bacterium]
MLRSYAPTRTWMGDAMNSLRQRCLISMKHRCLVKTVLCLSMLGPLGIRAEEPARTVPITITHPPPASMRPFTKLWHEARCSVHGCIIAFHVSDTNTLNRSAELTSTLAGYLQPASNLGQFAQSFDDSFSNEHYVVYYFVLED